MNCEKKLATFEKSPKNAIHPVATSSPPATNSIGPRKRLIRFMAASEKLIAAAAIRNGIARPSEYTASKKTAFAMFVCCEASRMTLARNGPTHGDQPAANPTPTKNDARSERFGL